MAGNEFPFNFNVFYFFFLFALLRESSLTRNEINGNEDNTGKGLQQTNNLVDLSKNDLDVEIELPKIIEEILQKYQELKDFKRKPTIDLVIVLSNHLRVKKMLEILQEIIEDMLSNVSVIPPANQTESTKAIDFSVDVKEQRNNTINILNIKLTFKLSNKTLECLDKSNQENNVTTAKEDSTLWCFNKIRWNSNQETRNRTFSKSLGLRSRNLEALSIIDMSGKNWMKRLDHIIRDDLEKKSTQLDINLLAPKNYESDHFLIMLKQTHELVNQQVEGAQSVKYLVRPRMYGNKLWDLDMTILVTPLDEEDEEKQNYLKNMCIEELIPRLQQLYSDLWLQYESVFNAVRIDKDNESDNRYRLVLRVQERDDGKKISFSAVRNIVLELRAEDYKNIRLKNSHDFEFTNPEKDCLIVTFEIIEPQFKDTQEFVQKIFEKQILSYLKKSFPDDQLEMNIKRNEVEYPAMYDVDKYEVTIRVLEDGSNKISPEMLQSALEKLTKKHEILTVTCNILETERYNPTSEFLKLCLEVKKMKENCYNPWSPEGKKEFLLSALNDTKPPVVPPGGTPPREERFLTPPGGYSSRSFKRYVEFHENLLKG